MNDLNDSVCVREAESSLSAFEYVSRAWGRFSEFERYERMARQSV